MLLFFNPLPSSEGRQNRYAYPLDFQYLQSTSLIRGKTICFCQCSLAICVLQSTSLIRGKTSIVGSDKQEAVLQSTSLIRGKTRYSFGVTPYFLLQSTSLIRGKTSLIRVFTPNGIFFNPLPSSEGRLALNEGGLLLLFFNPLPSSEGRLKLFCHNHLPMNFFNPLPSSEGRLHSKYSAFSDIISSIHFPHPREDCDAPCIRSSL